MHIEVYVVLKRSHFGCKQRAAGILSDNRNVVVFSSKGPSMKYVTIEKGGV